jgi:large subunit ribosomal protein L1
MKFIKEKVNPGSTYSVLDAITLLSELSKVKFKETFEVAVRLGVDPRKSDQVVRGACVLPHGTGKYVRVAVFAQGAQADAAKESGAEYVGMDDLADLIKNGMFDFDVVIASPDAMRVVGKLGQVLGPRGLMPNPKVGTVAQDVAAAVKNAKAGQVRYRADKAGIIHCGIGQIGFTVEQIKENLESLLNELKRAKPAAAKGTYLRKVTLSTTMGPGLTVDLTTLVA